MSGWSAGIHKDCVMWFTLSSGAGERRSFLASYSFIVSHGSGVELALNIRAYTIRLGCCPCCLKYLLFGVLLRNYLNNDCTHSPSRN